MQALGGALKKTLIDITAISCGGTQKPKCIRMQGRDLMCQENSESQDLDLDCWQLILDKLSLSDLARFQLVCKQYRDIGFQATTKTLKYINDAELANSGRDGFDDRDGHDHFKIRKRTAIAASLFFYIRKRAQTLQTIIIRVEAGGSIAQRILDAVSSCTALRVLEVHDNRTGNRAVGLVLRDLPASLRILKLSHDIVGFTDQMKPWQLRVMSCNKIPSKIMQEPMALTFFMGLKALCFKCTEGHTEDFVEIRRLTALLHTVEILSIRFSAEPDIEAVFWSYFTAMPYLRDLTLIGMGEVLAVPEPLPFSVDSKLTSLKLALDACRLKDLERLLKIKQLEVLTIDLLTTSSAEPQVFPSESLCNSNLKALHLVCMPDDAVDIDESVNILLDLGHLLAVPKLQLLTIGGACAINATTVALNELQRQTLRQDLQAKMDFKSDPNPDTLNILTNLGFQSKQGALVDGSEFYLSVGVDPLIPISRYFLGSFLLNFEALVTRPCAEEKIYKEFSSAAFLTGIESCMHFQEANIYKAYLEYTRKTVVNSATVEP